MNTPTRSTAPVFRHGTSSVIRGNRRRYLEKPRSPAKPLTFGEGQSSEFQAEMERIRKSKKEKEMRQEIKGKVEKMGEDWWMLRGSVGFYGNYLNL